MAAHEPAIAAAVQAADARTHAQLEDSTRRVRAEEWPAATDPALEARLFTAGLYGLMAQWHLTPGSFSWDAAASLSLTAHSVSQATPLPRRMTRSP